MSYATSYIAMGWASEIVESVTFWYLSNGMQLPFEFLQFCNPTRIIPIVPGFINIAGRSEFDLS